MSLENDIIEEDERRVLTLVETMTLLHPDVEIYSYEKPDVSEYESIVWGTTPHQEYTEQYLEENRLSMTKEQWIVLLMEEANLIQEEILSLHTISKERSLQQKILYDMKYTAAAAYVKDVAEFRAANQKDDSYLPTTDEVVPGSIILEEATLTGDPVYYLALAVVQNYLSSEASLSYYFGMVEGQRRLCKQRILACGSIEELENVEWVTWPDYIGHTNLPSD